ncbi:MAG TPA: TonB-dependent receptor [Holophagaceae bacterium]|nr:TonB-dependent receptor [Holophagaceae bacterium]
MNRVVSRLGFTTFALVAGTLPMMAQGTQTANITGTVVDASGAPVAGATVRLSSPSMQGVRAFSTDGSGKFIARLLPPGAYTIEVVKEGMDTRKINQALGIDQTFTPKITMTKSGAAVVEVIAAAPAVDKTDVKLATNWRSDSVDALPNGRAMENVALLTPGVTVGVGGRVQIHGAMTSGNLYLLDGQNIADNAYNNRGVRLIDDSIEEIQVITGSISAEYGDVDGGVVNAITKSGSNEFAGSLRWELSNPAWNALQPMQSRTALSNKLNEEKTLNLSGFIIKDRLWFSASYFKTDQTGTGTITADLPNTDYTPLGGPWVGYVGGDGPGGLGTPYDTGRKEIRRQIKLTFALNQDHTIIGSFVNARVDEVNRNYSAGEIKALVPQVSTSDFTTLQWRALWSSNFVTELKVGQKNQKLSAGGTTNGQSPLYNYTIRRYYNNGIFNSGDGGDNRGNKTFNFKASYFWNAAGSHQTDFGVDRYEGIQKARNEQTPSGYIFGVNRMNLALQMARPLDVWTYVSSAGTVHNYSTGLYANDKWTVNQNLNFNLGLRFDNYKAQDESGSKTAGASGISPRLGMKYDFLGNSKYVAGLSLARYNAKVLEGITNSVTNVGNPTEIDHPAFAAFSGAPQTFAAIQNLSNYDFTTISYYNNPVVNVRLSDKLKAPTVNEVSANFAYSFDSQIFGNGFVRVTGVSKSWKNLIDYRIGNEGQVDDGTGNMVYLKVWDNSSLTKREYRSLELDAQLTKGAWSFVGNITWSRLTGNYEGEGGSTPARGEGLQNFTVQDGVTMYDRSITTPDGYLAGHVPLRSRLTASYTSNNEFGKTTWGLVYRFDSGAHYSATRTIAPTDLNPGIAAQYGTSATQYMGGRGKAGVFNATSYLDLAITQDFNLFKVGSKQVAGFVKLNIGNLFNHQQLTSWDIQYADNSGGALTDPFAPADPAKFGAPQTNADFGAARDIKISTGFRF